MMQPMDIKSQSFKKGLFGYSKVDVDQYVDTVYRAYDELFTENKNLRDEKDRLNKVIEEQRLKLFDLENQVQGVSPASTKKEEVKAESKPAKEEPKKEDDGKIKMATKEPESATSKFFQESNDDIFGDGEDVFVGEIEDNRKPSKVMIGDGEEEGSDDFEFL